MEEEPEEKESDKKEKKKEKKKQTKAQTETPIEERKKAYKCDVCYITNSEVGFDYLKYHLPLKHVPSVHPILLQRPSSEKQMFYLPLFSFQ